MLFIGMCHLNERKDAFTLAFVCGALAILAEVAQRSAKKVQRFFLICFVTSCILFLYCEICILSQIYQETNGSNEAEYILVLGNKLDSQGKVTDTLKYRLDVGVELHREYNIPIIVSGGNGIIESSEANAMRLYLSEYISASDIITEYQAQDTWQNFFYTADLMKKETSVIVVTSDFHMYRSLLIARKLGYESIQAKSAKTPGYMCIYYHARETVAIMREYLRLFGKI